MERDRDPKGTPPGRIAGALYLVLLIAGIFAEGFVSSGLVVNGDAGATAATILAHRGRFELGFSVYLVEMACQVALAALFYDLLRPAGKRVSLVAAYVGLAGCTIKTVSRLFFLAPLLILGGAGYLKVFGRGSNGRPSVCSAWRSTTGAPAWRWHFSGFTRC